MIKDIEKLAINNWLEINNYEINLIKGDDSFYLLEKVEEFGFDQSDYDQDWETWSYVVARILLVNIQERLPNTAIYSDDKLKFTRIKINKSKSTSNKIAYFPQRLFRINWADTAPGMSWPEDYFITYVPFCEYFFITASADENAFGGISSDTVLGAIKNYDVDYIKPIITQHWQNSIDLWEQKAWGELSNEGLVGENEINKWREETWNDNK